MEHGRGQQDSSHWVEDIQAKLEEQTEDSTGPERDTEAWLGNWRHGAGGSEMWGVEVGDKLGLDR